MDPNATGFSMLQQQQQHFPVTSQSPQQFPYYPNAIPSYPQQKAPSHLPQQHSFGAMPMQAGAPGGAMMPAGFPQHSGTSYFLFRFIFFFFFSLDYTSLSFKGGSLYWLCFFIPGSPRPSVPPWTMVWIVSFTDLSVYTRPISDTWRAILLV